MLWPGNVVDGRHESVKRKDIFSFRFKSWEFVLLCYLYYPNYNTCKLKEIHSAKIHLITSNPDLENEILMHYETFDMELMLTHT